MPWQNFKSKQFKLLDHILIAALHIFIFSLRNYKIGEFYGSEILYAKQPITGLVFSTLKTLSMNVKNLLVACALLSFLPNVLLLGEVRYK